MAWRKTAEAKDLRGSMGLRGTGASKATQVAEQDRKRPLRRLLPFALVAVAVLAASILLCRSSSASPVDLTSAGLTPGDAFLYAAVNTDLDSSQWIETFRLAEKFGAEDARAQLEDSITDSGNEWEEDVAPFLGGDAAVFVRQVLGGEGGWDGGIILRCANTTDAMAVLREQAAGQGITLERRPYAGGVYEADDANSAYVAVLGEHIVITMNEQTLQDVIDTYRNEAPSLAESLEFQAVRDGVVNSFLAFTYIDPRQLKAEDAEFVDGLEASGLVLGESGPFAGVITASKDLFTFEQAFPAAEGVLAGLLEPRVPAFAERVPANTALFVSATDLAPLLDEAEDATSGADDGFDAGASYAISAADLAWLFAGAPFELGEMGPLAELMTGEMAVASWPASEKTAAGSVLLAEVDDPEAARTLAIELAAGYGDAGSATGETVEGVEVTVVGDGAVAVVDGVLVAGSLEGVRQVIEGPDSPLTESPVFQRASERLGTPLGSFVYFNVLSFFGFQGFAEENADDPVTKALESVLFNAVQTNGLTRLAAIVLAME